VPLLGVVQEKVRSDVMLGFTSDAYLAQQVNPRVMNIVEKVTAFKLQTRALEKPRQGISRARPRSCALRPPSC